MSPMCDIPEFAANLPNWFLIATNISRIKNLSGQRHPRAYNRVRDSPTPIVRGPT